jgi:endonuclease YncB( thermonuclease family)
MKLSLPAMLATLTFATAALADPCEAPLPSPGTVFSGPVEYLGDGDSLCVRTAAGLVEVRVADFYAPELHEPGGPEAKATAQRLFMGRTLRCEALHRSYDRIVARCTLAGESIGDLLREAGVPEGGRGFR